MVLEGEIFWGVIGSGGQSSHKWDWCPVKEAPEIFLAPSAEQGHGKIQTG